MAGDKELNIGLLEIVYMLEQELNELKGMDTIRITFIQSIYNNQELAVERGRHLLEWQQYEINELLLQDSQRW